MNTSSREVIYYLPCLDKYNNCPLLWMVHKVLNTASSEVMHYLPCLDHFRTYPLLVVIYDIVNLFMVNRSSMEVLCCLPSLICTTFQL